MLLIFIQIPSNYNTIIHYMGRTKTKAYDKLYVIEKLVKIVEENGEKFVLVKWKNFSDAQSTLEPLSYFTQMLSCRDDLQKLEEEF